MQDAIKQASGKALRKAKSICRCTRYRGASLIPMKDGERAEHGEPIFFKGLTTRKMIEEVIVDYDVDEIWYSNGLDGADTVADLNSGNYEPWVADFDVLVWKEGD